MRRIVLLAVCLLVAGACAADDEAASPTPTASPAAGLARTCTAPEYTIGYPEGWHVNEPSEDAPCRWFHPEPFELPEDTEALGIAITVDIEDLDFGTATDPDSPAQEEITRQELTVAGRQAVRVEAVATGEALLEEGVKILSYSVEWDDRTLIASTLSTAAAGDFEENAAVLERMVGTLEVNTGADAACSAAGEPLEVRPEALPDAVSKTRLAIAQAARDCDYERLNELAGPDFSFSFGAVEGGPGAYWQEQESEPRGPEPMRFLLGMLQRPRGTVEVGGETTYVWPSAFAYESWDAVPEADRRALKPLYDEEDFERFAEFGGYAGYRVGIAADGSWQYFIAGD